MTICETPLSGDKPKYREIADRIRAAISAGELKPGQRLPTQRELAERLDITVGTVTRAYDQAARQGLISAEVGRGSFVLARDSGTAGVMTLERPEGVCDLSINFPASTSENLATELLNAALESICRDKHAHRLLRHHPHEGTAAHRAAGAELLKEADVDTAPDNVLICAGTQHALLILFLALVRPGDAIAAEELTYPGLKSLAASLGVRIHGVAMDDYGVIPAELDTILSRGRIAALYTIPTLQNPTAVTMPAQRRREIVEITRKNGVPIIEDNIYGLLPERTPPALAKLDNDNVFHILGISKGIAPGLRIAYLHAPARYIPVLAAAIRNSIWMVPPLMAEVARLWIASGLHRRILAAKRDRMNRRLGVARRLLSGMAANFPETGLHCWLPLPHGKTSEQLARAARQQNVIISPARDFAVGSGTIRDGIRICLHAARTEDELEHGLRILAQVYRGETGSAPALI